MSHAARISSAVHSDVPQYERLPARDDVGHRPHRLLDRRVRVGAVAEEQVDEVEAEPLERAVDRLHAGTCGSACCCMFAPSWMPQNTLVEIT